MPLMRLIYVLAVGLTLGGIVHIATLLAVPLMAPQGAYDRLANLGADGKFAVLPEDKDGAALMPFRDPSFLVAACRYDVSTGPVTVRAALPTTYGALSVHNRFGQPFYALTDKAATNGAVEVTIFGSQEVAAAEIDEQSGGPPALRIVSPTPTGVIVVRLFVAGESAREALKAVAEKASCERAKTVKVSP